MTPDERYRKGKQMAYPIVKGDWTLFVGTILVLAGVLLGVEMWG